MKVVAVIEARMTSSRLPGKVLLPALGQPMIYHLINRLKSVASLDDIVLATTANPSDDILVAFSQKQSVSAFRGSESDVMGRVIGAASMARADIIVEITADCPIIDPDIVEQTIQMFKAHTCSYVSNVQVRSFPDGMDTQVFPLSELERSAAMTQDALDREHVSLHMRNNPQLFSQVHLVAPPSQCWPGLGLTLDEEADYVLLKKIIEKMSPINHNFSCREIIQLLRDNPEWCTINRNVIRKGNT